jgi:hypothetical protein
VVDLQAVRAKRATRWGLFAAAAAVALAVGGSGAEYLATREPASTLTFPTYSPPSSNEQLAASLKKRGLRACAMGYYGEGLDSLDEAAKHDANVDNDPAVQAARRAIDEAYRGHAPGLSNELYSKPPLGPGERPLQRTP